MKAAKSERQNEGGKMRAAIKIMRRMITAGQLIQQTGQQILTLCLVILLAWGITGCSQSQLRSQSARVPRLVITALSDPKTFNSIAADESSSTFVLSFLYTGLLETNGITGKLTPGLAEAYEISDDQKRIVFTLRQGLKWSDGVPLTVDDIVFYYNDIVFNPKIPSSEADVMRIGEKGEFPIVRKVDDRRVEFIAPEPFAPLLRFAGGSFLPKHILESSVKTLDAEGNPQFMSVWGTDTDPQQIVGNGSYRLKQYVPSQRVILERNPYYWKQDAQGKPQPYIDQVVIETVDSEDTSFIQFRSGGTDLESIDPGQFSLLKAEEKRGNFTIYNGGPSTSTSFITFNLNKGKINGKPVIDPNKSRWFNTLAFRQAVAHAIDRTTMINNIFQGLAKPLSSQIHPQSPYYLPPESGLPVYDYNPEKAKQLLRQAGFQYNPQGQLLDQNNQRVRFTLTTNAGNKIREAIATQIIQDLEKIGMKVDFQPLAFNTLIAKSDNTLDWEAMILGIGGAPFEPDGGKNTWSPEGNLHLFNQKPSGNQAIEGREVSDWEQQIYKLYVEGGRYLDDQKRKEAYGKAQILIQQNLPFIYLINPLALSAVRNTVKNVQFSAAGGALWNMDELKLVD